MLSLFFYTYFGYKILWILFWLILTLNILSFPKRSFTLTCLSPRDSHLLCHVFKDPANFVSVTLDSSQLFKKYISPLNKIFFISSQKVFWHRLFRSKTSWSRCTSLDQYIHTYIQNSLYPYPLYNLNFVDMYLYSLYDTILKFVSFLQFSSCLMSIYLLFVPNQIVAPWRQRQCIKFCLHFNAGKILCVQQSA